MHAFMTWEVPGIPLGSFLKEYQNNPTYLLIVETVMRNNRCLFGAFPMLISVGFY